MANYGLVMFFVIAWQQMGAPQAPTRAWTYPKLFQQADLVVLAKFESDRRADSATSDKPPTKDSRPIVATFSVVKTLKGEHKGKQVVVFYYERKPGVGGGQGQALWFRTTALGVEYETGGLTQLDVPEYLLFLRARSDGRYEFASGTSHIGQSVKEVNYPFGP